jgi:lipid-binding SYLF domain-containing protein
MRIKFLAHPSAAVLAIGSVTGCSTTTTGSSAGSSPVAKRQSIDAEVDAALSRLYAQDPGARELVAKARGTLVFPSVISAGFVVGGSYGEGALRIHGRNERYYKTAAGSVGLLAGAQSKAVYLLFMTQESLDKFIASNGWTVGADASVAMINVGANASADSAAAQQAVIGYVLTTGGLMANLSLEGTKISPLTL